MVVHRRDPKGSGLDLHAFAKVSLVKDQTVRLARTCRRLGRQDPFSVQQVKNIVLTGRGREDGIGPLPMRCRAQLRSSVRLAD
jgi:hypothetical protein